MKLAIRLPAMLVLAVAAGGCVMTEKYDAEKTRALNFQRLLAQEEKRTGELDAEVKRLKRETTENDAKVRELSAQLQAVREQLAKTQEDLEVAQASAAQPRKDERPRAAAMPKAKKARPAPPPEPTSEEETALGRPAPAPEPEPAASANSTNEPRYHSVKYGENLYRIARKYGLSVDKLRQLNGLNGNEIEVGQKLIVGYE